MADSDLMLGAACLVCTHLKRYQTDCVEDLRARSPQSLCNVHTWLVAKSAEAGAAADVLLHMLEHALKDSADGLPCDLCARMVQEENRIIDELTQKLQKPAYVDWFYEHGGICVPHGQMLLDRIPKEVHDRIILTLQRQAGELRSKLAELSRNARSGMEIRPGLLGRAAEFLVAKRGFGSKS